MVVYLRVCMGGYPGVYMPLLVVWEATLVYIYPSLVGMEGYPGVYATLCTTLCTPLGIYHPIHSRVHHGTLSGMLSVLHDSGVGGARALGSVTEKPLGGSLPSLSGILKCLRERELLRRVTPPLPEEQ